VKERDMLDTYILADALQKTVVSVGIVGIGVGTGLAGYALYQWLKEGPFTTIPKVINDTVDRYDEIYTDPTTQAVRAGVDAAARGNPIIRFWRIFVPFV